MKRFVSTLAAAALTAGLLSVGTPASAVNACPDPQEAAGGTVYVTDPVVLGPHDTAELTFEMVGRTACLDLYPPSIRINTPARVIPVEPTTVTEDRETGATTLRGTFTADATQLTNADAGEWVFDFAAGDVSSASYPVNVLRATTLSLNAGPEPLRRNHRLTLRGRLRVADWEHDRDRGLRDQPIRIFAIDSQTTPVWVPLAEPQTGRHGRYRVRREVPGPDRYQAVYLGTNGIAQATSPIDEVAART